MRLHLWRIFSLYNGLLYLETQLTLQYARYRSRTFWRCRFCATGLAPSFWRRPVLAHCRFGAGRFGANIYR